MNYARAKLQMDAESGMEGANRRKLYGLSNPSFVKDVAPGIVVLFVAILFSLSFGRSQAALEPVFVKTALRFLRIALVLSVPLSVLLPLYRVIIDRGRSVLLRVEPSALDIQPLKHWLFRPFQGIGIAFLFRTKLLTMVQFVGGPASLFRHGGGFDARQFFLTSAVAVSASSSFLPCGPWTTWAYGMPIEGTRS